MSERIESISQVEEAVNRARSEIFRADACVRSMANLIAGRLQESHIGFDTLCKLKRELEKYNMHTGKWRD